MATVLDAPETFLEEIVTGSRSRVDAPSGLALAQEQDDILRRFGQRTYEFMSLDPSNIATMAILVSSALGDGPVLTPAVKAMPGEIISKRKRKQDILLSDEICQFNIRGLARLDAPIEETLEDWMYDGLTYGSSSMEQTYELVDDETGSNKLMLKTLAVKPRWAWKFRVDSSMRIVALKCRTMEGDTQDVDRNKFGIFTWQKRYRDPRGMSIYRPGYPFWNYKVQQYPDLAQYLKHFADPSVIIKAGEEADDKIDTNSGKQLTVSQQALEIGKMFRSHSVLGLPFGWDATLIEARGNGEAYHSSFDLWDIQMIRSVLIGTRPFTEAKNDSKANNESGLDLMSIAAKRVRKPPSRSFRDDVIYWQTRLNYGKEIADRLTPEVNFGTMSRDYKALTVIIDAYSKKVLKEGHLPKIWDEYAFGEPIEGMKPDPNVDPNAKPNQDPNADPNADPKKKDAANKDKANP